VRRRKRDDLRFQNPSGETAPLPFAQTSGRQFSVLCDEKSLRVDDLPICADNFHFRALISRSVRAFPGSCGHLSIRAGNLPFRAGQLPVRATIFPSVRAFFDLCGQKNQFLVVSGESDVAADVSRL
jgi:hypothetical protein